MGIAPLDVFSRARMEVMKHTEGAQRIGDLLRDKNIVLKGADALSQRGFTQVPNHVLRSDKISPGAKPALRDVA